MDDTHFYYFLAPAMAVVVIASVIVRSRSGREPTELHKAITRLKFGALITGAFLLMLWFLLPCTPVLSTFGYPQSTEEIQTAKQVLRYLQDYNRALVRLTMVLSWFLFAFIWWFLSTVYALSNALKKVADDQNAKSYEKPAA